MKQMIQEQPTTREPEVATDPSRRHFLKYAGGIAGVGILLSACHKDDNNTPSSSTPGVNADGSINLGGGDVGILNYAYALEQLEAAFYIQVIANPYTGMNATEKALLTDIRDHEIAHREFFKAALGTNAIPALIPNFTSIDFTSRANVLDAAKTFEDLGVAAYNGAGALISSPDYLLLAGKIVSVEARHASLIRTLISANSFADSTAVDANGLDQAKSPTAVLTAASGFLVSKIDASHLPTA